MDILRLARTRGYALNKEELFLGDMTLAAPIPHPTGCQRSGCRHSRLATCSCKYPTKASAAGDRLAC